MRSERGYVEMRLLVVLALVAALVWVLPSVVLSGRERDPGAAAARAPFGVTAPLPAVPGATGASGVARPAEHAYDLQAQSTLNGAVRVAQVYYAERGSFQGFGPDVAVEYDPSVVYSQGSPIANMVSMTVTPTTVVLVTMADGFDGAGGYLCAAVDGDTVTFGRVNATMPSQCQGGWG
jgi:hypothetical protein